MNTETGKVYRGDKEIREALERGEPIVPVSEDVAKAQQTGQRILSRNARRRKIRKQNNRKKKNGRKKR